MVLQTRIFFSGWRKVVLQTQIFFWFKKSGWPEKKSENHFSRTTFLKKLLQIKWLNALGTQCLILSSHCFSNPMLFFVDMAIVGLLLRSTACDFMVVLEKVFSYISFFTCFSWSVVHENQDWVLLANQSNYVWLQNKVNLTILHQYKLQLQWKILAVFFFF